MIRLGILSSSRGSHLETIREAIRQKKLDANIAVVASNKPTAPVLVRAKSFGLTTTFVGSTGLPREIFDLRLSDLLKQYEVDLIVLMGFMRILSASFISAWKNKIMNVHPSLLPAYAGMMDLNVHRAVLAAKEKETGCTVHYVTEAVDGGPIILQKTCPVLPDDTPEKLKARVQQLEGQALLEAILKVNG